MMTGDHTSSTVTLEATTLLAHIGQVVHWLPKREAPRAELDREVARMEQHLATATPSWSHPESRYTCGGFKGARAPKRAKSTSDRAPQAVRGLGFGAERHLS